MFNYFKNRKLIKNASDTLFIKMNEYARNPNFFGENRVEDDPDGRFELVALFATAIFCGLGKRGELETKIAQNLFDKIFKSFDQALREFGISDLKVGSRVKIMAESFYGRQTSYIKAFDSGDMEALSKKIALNVLSIENGTNDFSHELSNNFIKLAGEIRELSFAS